MAVLHLSSCLRRRPIEVASPHSPLLRQWELLDWLSSSDEGVTVADAASALGVDEKTIRRDLILLRKAGFDLRESVEDHNRKRWRLRTRFEAMRTSRQKYRAVRDNLGVLLDQAQQLQDQRLVDDLRALRRRVARNCR